MDAFLNTVLSFPTVIFTVLLGVACLHLLLSVLGLFHLDVIDVDLNADGHLGDVEGLAGLMVTLGLSGVPAPVVFTLVALSGWVISFLLVHFLFFWESRGVFHYLAATGTLLLSGALAVFVSARLVKPLKPMFARLYSNTESQSRNLLGLTCSVRSQTVDADFGEASAVFEGAQLLLKVRYQGAQPLPRGTRVVIVAQDPVKGTYQVIPETEFQQLP